jgi:hypothetical protein
MNATTALTLATLAAMLCAGCDNPLRSDNGESTPAEDDAAIIVYTQTVNQASQDTAIAPTVNIDGNNNSVIIIVGDDNAPENSNRHDEIPTPAEEEAAP